MKIRATKILLLLVLAILSQYSFAQSNTSCSNPIQLFCGEIVTANTTGLSNTDINNCIEGGPIVSRKILWYSVIGDGSTINLSTCAIATDFDTRIHLYDSPCQNGIATNLNCFDGNDDANCIAGGAAGYESSITFESLQGQVYLIAISGWTNSTGNFALSMNCSNVPCPNAVEVLATNDPICLGENSEFFIGSTISGSPASTVYYTINGVSGNSIVLDGNGEATISVNNSNAVNLVLDSVTNQAGYCTIAISANLSTVNIYELEPVTISANNSICGNEDAIFTIQPGVNNASPGATVSYNINGSFNTVVLDNNGMANINLGQITETTTIELSEILNPACSISLSETVTIEYFLINDVDVSASQTACENIATTYTIDAANGSNASAGATVNYILDGEMGSVVLDNNGMAIVTSDPLVSNSNIVLTEINSPCDTIILNASAMIELTQLNSVTVSSVSPICENEIGTYTIVPEVGSNPSPGSTVIYTLNGIQSSVVLDANGIATINTAPLTENSFIAISQVTNNCGVLNVNETAQIFTDPDFENDICSMAEPVNCGDVVSGNTICASSYNDICNGDLPSFGLWYKITGNNNLVEFSTCSANSEFNTIISTFIGDCNDLICFGKNNDDTLCGIGNGLSTIEIFAESGVEYFVFVSGFDPTHIGNFELSVNCVSTCVPDIVLFGTPDAAGTYEADNWIISTSKVNNNVSPNAVNYYAGDEFILLQQGFVADGTVDFSAEIIDCNPGG